MIVDVMTMKEIENQSGLSTLKLMQIAGTQCATFIMDKIDNKQSILVLCGNGNNGGDGFVISQILINQGYKVKVCLVSGKPQSKEALKNYQKIDAKYFIDVKNIKRHLTKDKVIIDCIFGFGYHGLLTDQYVKLFTMINNAHATVISIDINSGASADKGSYAKEAIKSDYTLALECYKPFHMLNKEHHLFKECVLIDLNIKTKIKSNYITMDDKTFIKHYPFKQVNAYKGSNGKPLLIAGSYGMAGACSLNIMGAKSTGCSYISVACHEDIYPIVASKEITSVYHPFGSQTFKQVLLPLLDKYNVISYGSGCANLDCKEDILEILLQYSHTPIILDAEAINLLDGNTYLFKLSKPDITITPHLKEFADLIGKPLDVVSSNKIELLKQFVNDYHVLTVLKGPNTIVVSPDGRMYINQTGNQSLATAGTGDLLTGMIASLNAMIKDRFLATCMAVWFHGYLADLGMSNSSITCYDITNTYAIANAFFKSINQ